MENIKTCPLCGSEAKLENNCGSKGGNVRLADEKIFYYVQCCNKHCRLRTDFIFVGHNEWFKGKRNVNVTPDMAAEHAVEKWNERVTPEEETAKCKGD